MTLFQEVQRSLHIPKRSLSQNFIIQPHVLEQMLTKLPLSATDTVVEIGPGLGAITRKLLASANTVIAIEKDRALASYLKEHYENLTLIVGDALDVELPACDKLVSNLPFHLTTPLLEKIFRSSFSEALVIVQKEVADRMVAKPHTKQYGSLTLFTQFYVEILSCTTISAQAFFPAPSVDAALVCFRKRKEIPQIEQDDFKKFVQNLFSRRRKMIRSSIPAEALSACCLTGCERPENLLLETWIELYKACQK